MPLPKSEGGEGRNSSLRKASKLERMQSPLQHYSATSDKPEVSHELIDHLVKVYPVQVAEHHTIRDYDVMLGQQQVINHLKSLLEDGNT